MTLRGKTVREILGVGLLAVLAWLVVEPLFLVLSESLWKSDGGFSLDAFRLLLSRPSELRALWLSLGISVASVFLAAAIGIPLAVLFSRFDFPGRRVLGALVALPVVLPPLVGVVSFLFLYGEAGFFARLVRLILDLDEAPWRLEGAWAILLVHAYSMYVYFYLFTRACWPQSIRRFSRRRLRWAPGDFDDPHGPATTLSPPQSHGGLPPGLHDGARVVQCPVRFWRRVSRDDDADRLHKAQRRLPDGHGGDGGAHPRRPRGTRTSAVDRPSSRSGDGRTEGSPSQDRSGAAPWPAL